MQKSITDYTNIQQYRSAVKRGEALPVVALDKTAGNKKDDLSSFNTAIANALSTGQDPFQRKTNEEIIQSAVQTVKEKGSYDDLDIFNSICNEIAGANGTVRFL